MNGAELLVCRAREGGRAAHLRRFRAKRNLDVGRGVTTLEDSSLC